MKIFMTLMMTMLMGTFASAACVIGEAGKCTLDECKAQNKEADTAVAQKFVFKDNTCVANGAPAVTDCFEGVDGKRATVPKGTLPADKNDATGSTEVKRQ